MKSTPLLRLCLPLLVGAACVVPPQEELSTPVGLEAPVLSPPGDYTAQQRVTWWDSRLSRLSEADRAEASLCLGELYLELNQPAEARMAFLDARGAELSAAEVARADRGIGLSYYLDGRPALGERRLQDSLTHLEEPARADVAWLLAASGGTGGSGATADFARSERMGGYLAAAGLEPVIKRTNPAGNGRYYDISRSEWRAASLSGNHDPMETPWRITVHHSAMYLDTVSLERSKAEVREIQKLHQRDRHWADVGYHFLIDRAGRIHEGRELDIQGAHATGSNNRGNIGICLLGNFAAQPELGKDYERAQRVSEKQWESLERLVEELRGDYDIAPKSIYAHKRFTGTECPGPVLISWVKRYNARSSSN